MNAAQAAAPAGSRTFFSVSAGLMFPVRHAQKHLDTGTGRVATIAGKYVKFTPMGGTNHGRFVTDDKEMIEALEARIASGANDVFDEQGYQKFVTPAEIQARNAGLALTAAQQENEDLRRELEHKNRLLSDYSKQQSQAPTQTVVKK